MNIRFVSIIVLFATIAVACSSPVTEETAVEKDIDKSKVSSELDSLTFYLAEPKIPDHVTDSLKPKPDSNKRRKLKDNEFYLGPVPQ